MNFLARIAVFAVAIATTTACTCAPTDFKDEVCNTFGRENDRILEVKIKKAGAIREDSRTTNPWGDGEGGSLSVRAIVKSVIKGKDSDKGKVIRLKSTYNDGMCGIAYRLKPGKFIVGIRTTREDIGGHVEGVYMCDFFYASKGSSSRRLPDNRKAYFKKLYRRC